MLKEYLSFGHSFLPSLNLLDQLTEAFYELLLGKYGLQIDLEELAQGYATQDHVDSREEELVYSERLTRSTLQTIIASQSTAFEAWPLARRFSLAVNSRGWVPETFIEMFRSDALDDLADYQDFQGRTALHWAAEHFASNSAAEAYAMRDGGSGAYAELCRKLIAIGADLHTLDFERGTPFSCMMRTPYLSFPAPWIRTRLAQMVRCWGNIVRSACALGAYAERESLLQSQFGDYIRKLRVEGISDIRSYRLSVSESSDLIIEVKGSLPTQLWEFRPPPGAWRTTTSRIDRVPWKPSPYYEGDEYYLWQAADRVISKPMPILMREEKPSTPSLATNFLKAWKDWITGVQDDHGFIATRSRGRMDSDRRHKKSRRAASVPAFQPLVDDQSVYPTGDRGLWFPGRWISRAHKCPLDISWKYSSDGWPSEDDSHRRCMQGRCDDREPELLATDYWEARLLGDMHNVKIARRFIGRFRPEWRGNLEERHRKDQRSGS